MNWNDWATLVVLYSLAVLSLSGAAFIVIAIIQQLTCNG